MLASTRRSRTTTSPRRRLHAGVALVAALSLGLAGCGDGDGTDDGQEVDAPADDGATDDGATDDGAADDGAADAGNAEEGGDGAEAPEAAGFETLEDGEVVPGIQLEAPVDGSSAQAQPTPTGSAYAASLEGEVGAVTVSVQFDGQSLDELLAGIDSIVESGQAEVSSDPEDIEVEGADEAARVELTSPDGAAVATGVFATVDGNAVSIAVEAVDGAEVDVDAIIGSIVIDADRLEAEGTLEVDGEDGGSADG